MVAIWIGNGESHPPASDPTRPALQPTPYSTAIHTFNTEVDKPVAWSARKVEALRSACLPYRQVLEQASVAEGRELMKRIEDLLAVFQQYTDVFLADLP
jgi:hypothetical protein